jgi:hypothetical protein
VPKSKRDFKRFHNRQIRTRQREACAGVGHAENVDLVGTRPRGRETLHANWNDDPGERAR